MSGYSLDQLLEKTGVNDLAGGEDQEKTASEEDASFAKLAERCRQAAEDDSEAVGDNQELVEKTAAVAIIERTLQEIQSIDAENSPEAEKTASDGDPRRAAFIKEAFARGYSPREVAEFLEKNAIFGRATRALQAERLGNQFQRAGRKIEKAQAKQSRSARNWQDLVRKAEGASDKEKEALISRMRRTLGDDVANTAITASGASGFKHLPGWRNLDKAVKAKAQDTAAAAKKTPDTLLTKSQVSSAANKYKKPAALAGGGALAYHGIAGGGGGNDRGKKGVVVVNS